MTDAETSVGTTRDGVTGLVQHIRDARDRSDTAEAERLLGGHPDHADSIRAALRAEIAEQEDAAAPAADAIDQLRTDLAASEARAARLRAAEAEVARARAQLAAAEEAARLTEEEREAERAAREAARLAQLESEFAQLLAERVAVFERFDRAAVEMRDALLAVDAIGFRLSANASARGQQSAVGEWRREPAFAAQESLRWRLAEAGLTFNLVVPHPAHQRQLGDVPVPDALAGGDEAA